LTKSKTFRNKEKITSNADKLTGTHIEPVVLRAESDEEDDVMPLDRIPSAHDEAEDDDLPRKQTRNVGSKPLAEDEEDDDKKKLGFNTSYEGFSIWGWVLCLLVDRKGGASKKFSSSDGQALMAEWITSTQLQGDDDG
jgi:hypothetical protein